jgi:hypothetical protein
MKKCQVGLGYHRCIKFGHGRWVPDIRSVFMDRIVGFGI